VDDRSLRRQSDGIGGHDGEETAERAAAMVATDSGRDVDKWKRLESRVPVDFESVREARRQAQEPPDWLEEWPDYRVDELVTDPLAYCARVGCQEVAANGYVCAGHLGAVSGGSE
jgi:hypothetical protein